MAKSHQNHKGQDMKNKNPSDATTQVDGTDNLDSNQSARSMSAGSDDTTVNTGVAEDAVSAVETLGTDKEFNTPYNLEETASKVVADVQDKASDLMSKAASLVDTQAVKKNLNLVKEKAQDLLHTSKDQVTNKYNSLSDDVKLRGMLVDDSIKARPYAYALGAVGIGFILGRAFSGKGKADLDVLVSTVNKLNLGSLAGMLGMKMGTETEADAKDGYNADQARKIG